MLIKLRGNKKYMKYTRFRLTLLLFIVPCLAWYLWSTAYFFQYTKIMHESGHALGGYLIGLRPQIMNLTSTSTMGGWVTFEAPQSTIPMWRYTIVNFMGGGHAAFLFLLFYLVSVSLLTGDSYGRLVFCETLHLIFLSGAVSELFNAILEGFFNSFYLSQIKTIAVLKTWPAFLVAYVIHVIIHRDMFSPDDSLRAPEPWDLDPEALKGEGSS